MSFMDFINDINNAADHVYNWRRKNAYQTPAEVLEEDGKIKAELLSKAQMEMEREKDPERKMRMYNRICNGVYDFTDI